MDAKNPYKIFNNYVLRSPLFSFSEYKKFTSQKTISDRNFKILCQNKIFREALFLASPSFFKEMDKWVEGEIEDSDSSSKIKSTILKYYSRMSSRCTPFGLFSGCSVGEFDESTHIELDNVVNYKRHTRLDMHYLVALSQDLIKNVKIKSEILFYPNTSAYEAGDKLRYVEYSYVNGIRKHDMMAVDSSEYLDRILDKAKEGCLLIDLAKELVAEDITLSDAIEFIEALVENQLLISELEPSVSGPEFLDQICSVLKKIKNESVQEIYNCLIIANQKIKILDSTIGNDPNAYLEISEHLKKLGTKFELNFLFQTDTTIVNKKNTISKNLFNNLLEVSDLLNKMTFFQSDTHLTEFKEAFLKRYETREVPLSKALDIEMGVGYKQNNKFGDLNPLIDDLIIVNKNKENEYYDIKWSPVNSIFQRKLHENKSVINLIDEDFSDINISWDDLPDTMSSIAEIVYVDNEEKIRFSGMAGATATMLLGRFSHSNIQIDEHVKQIINLENKINNENKLLAEIIHLPKSRSGNVITRPELRDYEIPYLARSIKPEARQLTINDLRVSVDNSGKIILRSNKLNKEVKPMMANAHNHTNNSLPIYHFLCDMQTQGLRQGIGLQLGALINNYDYIPRIEYKNIIIQDAIWHIKKKDIKALLDFKNDDELLENAINEFRNKLNIPRFVMLIQSDNELIINFENLNSVRMFLDSVKKLYNFSISEFLFSEKGIVKQNDNYFTNQLIISFYNEKKLSKSNG
ncbi:lantibiotic dehydratase family protein [Flavobacterium sp. KS-LB2]|uniref:lantibiotic dehydratase family protein n=1 Tax=Flavobacterium sp. KS-LB2 TaxID=3120525 RepID=UPI0030CD48EB